jgi:hypothetical protein
VTYTDPADFITKAVAGYIVRAIRVTPAVTDFLVVKPGPVGNIQFSR